MFFQNQTFVALDLETTGVDFQKDKIIEFAGVWIEKGKVTKKLEILINPEREISEVIQAITGISNQDVENQPIFSDVKQKIQDFISDKVVIGHNIQFDLNFLRENGVEVSQQSLDTYTLSSIFFPEEKSLALEVLSERFQIEHKFKHRALGDVLATVELLKIIYQKIAELKPTLREKINQFLSNSGTILKSFFSEVAFSKPKEVYSNQLSLFNSPSVLEITQEPEVTLILEDIRSGLNQDKPLLLEVPHQSKLVLECLKLLKNQQQSAVFAFYSPKLFNKILQANSFPKELISVLKNPHNYLCLEKWQKFLTKELYTETEEILAIKILVWLEQTETGDRDELNLTYEEYPLWFSLLSSNSSCTGHTHQACLWHRQIQQSKERPILMTYQNLLMEEYIPSARPFFVFEARDLEKSLTQVGTFKISLTQFLEVLQDLKNASELKLYQSQLNSQITSLEIIWGYFFHHFSKFEKEFSYPEKIIFNNELKAKNGFFELRSSLKEWLQKMDELLNLLQGFLKYKFQINQLENLLRDLQNFFDNSDENEIRWIHLFPEGEMFFYIQEIDLKSKTAQLNLQARPLFCLDENMGTAVISNQHTEYNFQYWQKTLSIENDFYLEKSYTFEKNNPPKVDLNFLYSRAVHQDLFQASLDFIQKTIVENQGKTMVLFSSYNQVHDYTKALVIKLKDLGYKILAQGNGGGTQKIKAIFENFPEQSVVFGIERSFHRDFFQPHFLKSIILTKLIFDAPNDPLIMARQAKFRNPFLEFALPRAILNFKQTYLKLQNSEQSLFVLDPRITEKDYGKSFLASLPQ